MAGATVDRPVTVQYFADNSGVAGGSLSTARFSENNIEYIGCNIQVTRQKGGIPIFALCQANTADRVVATCFTDNRDFIEAIGSIKEFSNISFQWSADGLCSSVIVNAQSFNIR
jgi:hypothetical protein